MFGTPWRVNSNKLVPRRGRRPRRSCNTCYVKKIKCDGVKPKCNWCAHQNLSCTYPGGLGPARDARSNSGSPLSQDSRHPVASGSIPTASTPTEPVNPTTPTQTSETWAPTFARNLQTAGRHLGNICTFNGMPFMSKSGRDWIKACTGEGLHLDQYTNEQSPRWLHSFTIDRNLPSGICDLPDVAFLYEILKQYDSSVFRLFFPILDLELFDSTVKAAYYNETSVISPGVNSAKACIFAFLALASTVVRGTGQISLKSSVEYARAAHSLLPGVFDESVNVDGLQTLLLLCLCSQGLAGDFSTIDNLLSAASRSIYQLKGHLPPHTIWDNPTPLNYHVRHLFWIAYVCDKGFSLVTGLAPMLEDTQCDLTFATIPPETLNTPNKPLHIHGDPLPGSYIDTYVHLAFIQSRIHRDLYTPKALHQPEADLLKCIRALDHAIEEWKNTLPPSNRPSFLPFSGNAPQSFDMRFSIFHLQYHHCMVMIHQASSRCASWAQNQDTRTTTSSLAISVTASRSLLGKFLHFRLELGPENLLFSLSYFIQASINLFSNILSRPLDSGNQGDLQLIGMMSDLIAKHHTTQDPTCYTAKIKFAGDVISELKRLAECAIDKADRETQL